MNPERTLLDPSTIDWPYDFYRQLRAEAPVYFDKSLNAWLISRYEDIREAAALDPKLSSFLGYSQGIAPPWAEELAASVAIDIDKDTANFWKSTLKRSQQNMPTKTWMQLWKHIDSTCAPGWGGGHLRPCPNR